VQRGVEIAELLNMPIVVSNGMESSIGLCTSLALAAALDSDLACGLGTGKLIAQDLIASPLVAINGQMHVQRLAPDPDALGAARARLSQEQAHMWMTRLEQAWHSEAAAPWHEKVGS
jgi:O-succinylbenzoate synthase